MGGVVPKSPPQLERLRRFWRKRQYQFWFQFPEYIKGFLDCRDVLRYRAHNGGLHLIIDECP